MLIRVDFITDDLSLSLSATRGLRVDWGYNEIASLLRERKRERDLNPKLVETHFPMKLSLDIIPGKRKWRCSYVGRVYTMCSRPLHRFRDAAFPPANLSNLEKQTLLLVARRQSRFFLPPFHHPC